jgi:regulatory protein
VEVAIGSLERDGYIDDASYARRYAEDRRQLDGWGAERIERALRDAGVGADDIAPILVHVTPETELAAALNLLKRRFRDPPADDLGRQRALGLLARRGYAKEVAYDAVRAFGRDGCD